MPAVSSHAPSMTSICIGDIAKRGESGPDAGRVFWRPADGAAPGLPGRQVAAAGLPSWPAVCNGRVTIPFYNRRTAGS